MWDVQISRLWIGNDFPRIGWNFHRCVLRQRKKQSSVGFYIESALQDNREDACEQLGDFAVTGKLATFQRDAVVSDEACIVEADAVRGRLDGKETAIGGDRVAACCLHRTANGHKSDALAHVDVKAGVVVSACLGEDGAATQRGGVLACAGGTANSKAEGARRSERGCASCQSHGSGPSGDLIGAASGAGLAGKGVAARADGLVGGAKQGGRANSERNSARVRKDLLAAQERRAGACERNRASIKSEVVAFATLAAVDCRSVERKLVERSQSHRLARDQVSVRVDAPRSTVNVSPALSVMLEP